MRSRSIAATAAVALVGALALAACSSDEPSGEAAEKHFAEGQKKALDAASQVGDQLRDAAQAQKKAADQ